MRTGLLSRCLTDFPLPVALWHTASLRGGPEGKFGGYLETRTDPWDHPLLTCDAAEE